MRYHELYEKRRNSDINKKLSASEELNKYAGQQDIFVSYTQNVGKNSHPKEKSLNGKLVKNKNSDGAKIGINPNNEFSTPIGIYTYPIDYVLKRNGNVPYANNHSYIWVLRLKPEINYLDASKYIKKDFDHDIKILKSKPYFNKKSYTDGINASYKNVGYAENIWNITKFLSIKLAETSQSSVTSIWNKIWRELGYYGVINYDGQGIIHNNEPTQAVFFSKNALEEVELIRNIRPMSIYDRLYHNYKFFIKFLMDGKIDKIDILPLINNYIDILSIDDTVILPQNIKNILINNINLCEYKVLIYILKKFTLSEKIKQEIIDINPKLLLFINNPSEKIQLHSLKVHNDTAVNFITSEKVLLYALKISGSRIRFINNPTEKMQLTAVAQDGKSIKYIKNPSEIVQLAAIKQNKDAIRFILTPSDKVKLMIANL